MDYWNADYTYTSYYQPVDYWDSGLVQVVLLVCGLLGQQLRVQVVLLVRGLLGHCMAIRTSRTVSMHTIATLATYKSYCYSENYWDTGYVQVIRLVCGLLGQQLRTSHTVSMWTIGTLATY